MNIKDYLGEPRERYLVARKSFGWGLRKKAQKGRECLKGLFYPRELPSDDERTGFFEPYDHDLWLFVCRGYCPPINSGEEEIYEDDGEYVDYVIDENGEFIEVTSHARSD